MTDGGLERFGGGGGAGGGGHSTEYRYRHTGTVSERGSESGQPEFFLITVRATNFVNVSTDGAMICAGTLE